MEAKERLVTEYDRPESYVYVPWPVDKLTTEAIPKERIREIDTRIANAQKIKGQ